MRLLSLVSLVACGGAATDDDPPETDADTDTDTDTDADTDTDSDTDTGPVGHETGAADADYHLLVADAAGTVYRIRPDGAELDAWTPALVGLVGVAWAGDGLWVSSGLPAEPFVKLDTSGAELARVAPQRSTALARMGLDVVDGMLANVVFDADGKNWVDFHDPATGNKMAAVSYPIAGAFHTDMVGVDFADGSLQTYTLAPVWLSIGADLHFFDAVAHTTTVATPSSRVFGIAALEDGTFWIVDDAQQLVHLDASGAELDRVDPPGADAYDLSWMPADVP